MFLVIGIILPISNLSKVSIKKKKRKKELIQGMDELQKTGN